MVTIAKSFLRPLHTVSQLSQHILWSWLSKNIYNTVVTRWCSRYFSLCLHITSLTPHRRDRGSHLVMFSKQKQESRTEEPKCYIFHSAFLFSPNKGKVATCNAYIRVRATQWHWPNRMLLYSPCSKLNQDKSSILQNSIAYLIKRNHLLPS